MDTPIKSFYFDPIFYFLGFLLLSAIVVIILIIIVYKEKVKLLEDSLNKMNRSLEEMDEQAKLIIRTDLELNKIQERLDKKINGLYTLQRISQGLTTSLETEQIFKNISEEHILELGFEKCLVFLWEKSSMDKMMPTLLLKIGYSQKEADAIGELILKEPLFFRTFEERIISSIQQEQIKAMKERINNIFKVSSFIFSPISIKEGPKGFIFLGNESKTAILTEGDQELISILANQIGQALENALLFEQSWRSQQELERKVEERTRELTEAMEEINKVSKRKTDFVSSVSHELRTPLTSIKGYASILLAGKLGEVPSAVKERLAKINRHSDELTALVNDLLDISRIESGKVKMKMEPQDINQLVETVADLLSPPIKEKKIELIISIPDGLSPVLADRSQIERVLINLIGNATKFTAPDGNIKIMVNDIGDYLQVDIRDTGLGIAENDLPFIFEEFYRADNPINQQVKGTGLGLSLVKYIIEAHQGKIWVKSKLNEGSTFSFTLPKTA